ncbi:MAG: hypothetical protein IID44_15840 [Planctomycetes bacterium]|nr:hypothetical protein [Planctomycetota bacterium]
MMSKRLLHRQIMFALGFTFILAWVDAVTCATGHEVATRDGLRLTISEQGGVTDFQVGDFVLPLSRPGGVLF